MSQTNSPAQWDLRDPGLIMKDGNSEVHEFMGMWPLKPDADLDKLTKTLAFREFWNPPVMNFSEATTLLGLIRAARWFVGVRVKGGENLFVPGLTALDGLIEQKF